MNKLKSLKEFNTSFYKVKNNILERSDEELFQDKSVIINGESFKYQYLPIVPIIKDVLADELAMKYIMKFHRGR